MTAPGSNWSLLGSSSSSFFVFSFSQASVLERWIQSITFFFLILVCSSRESRCSWKDLLATCVAGRAWHVPLPAGGEQIEWGKWGWSHCPLQRWRVFGAGPQLGLFGDE